MIITAAGVIGGIAAVIALAAVVFGMTTPHMPSTAAPTQATGVQTPATATAQVPSAQPAPSAQVTTASVSSDPLGATAKTATTTKTNTPPAPVASASGVVVIDAGHQGQGNSSPEPEGPGSSITKPKVESGASANGVDESQLNLEIALRLQKVLESRGVTVIMVRTTQNVNIPNSERAKIANKYHAALFIRLHCDSSSSSGVTGILTLEPEKNWYKGIDMVGPSAVAAKDVQQAVLAATGAKDRGIQKRGDLSGFNWSQVPSVLVEMGLMSNPTEDAKLGKPAYQDLLATGMANGVVKFLQSR
jgi:N-acetylmuramoyl-L-alanine amidase